MYAVIETGGKQYRVQEGDIINIEKLDVAVGDTVEFDKILVLSDGGEAQIGAPYLDVVKVFGTVVENGKAQKVIIFKYKSKKDYRKKQGHRQPFTMVEIEGISADGKAPAKKAKKTAPTVEATDAADAVIEKKPAAKKAPAKKTAEDKPAVKKPAAKKPAAKKEVKDAE